MKNYFEKGNGGRRERIKAETEKACLQGRLFSRLSQLYFKSTWRQVKEEVFLFIEPAYLVVPNNILGQLLLEHFTRLL